VLGQPFPHFWPKASQPFHGSRQRLNDERIVHAKMSLKMRADLVCGPGRADEPDDGESLAAVLEDLKGGEEISLLAVVVQFVRIK